MNDNKMQTVKKAFKDTIPVMTGYIVLGIGFGILMTKEGFGVGMAALMSVFIYAGSMQFAAIPLLVAKSSFLTIAVTTLMVNARHFFYGISMLDKYKNVGKKKWYLIFGLTDETYSLVSRDNNDIEAGHKPFYFLMVTVFDHIYWVTGSVLGACLGYFITFSTYGIDFALTALFITIYTEQWISTKNHFAAITGILASVAARIIFGAENFLIPAMICIVTVLIIGRKYYKEEE